MENEQENKNQERISAKTEATRNSNDNFNDEQVDDYGIDKSAPDADEQLRRRNAVKSGIPTGGDQPIKNDDL